MDYWGEADIMGIDFRNKASTFLSWKISDKLQDERDYGNDFLLNPFT